MFSGSQRGFSQRSEKCSISELMTPAPLSHMCLGGSIPVCTCVDLLRSLLCDVTVCCRVVWLVSTPLWSKGKPTDRIQLTQSSSTEDESWWVVDPWLSISSARSRSNVTHIKWNISVAQRVSGIAITFKFKSAFFNFNLNRIFFDFTNWQ